jgi:hypothetical protein
VVGHICDQEDTLRLGQRAENVDMLGVISVRRISERWKDIIDDDGENILYGVLVESGSNCTIKVCSSPLVALVGTAHQGRKS